MYIGSFLKALFTPRKIWCSIYFLLNLVIVFFIFAAPGLMAEAEVGHWVGMGFIGVAVSMFSSSKGVPVPVAGSVLTETVGT